MRSFPIARAKVRKAGRSKRGLNEALLSASQTIKLNGRGWAHSCHARHPDEHPLRVGREDPGTDVSAVLPRPHNRTLVHDPIYDLGWPKAAPPLSGLRS